MEDMERDLLKAVLKDAKTRLNNINFSAHPEMRDDAHLAPYYTKLIGNLEKTIADAKESESYAGIGSAYNIPMEIVREAERRGLYAMATGGGFDYIYRDLLDDRRCMILADPLDSGSPDNLGDRASVQIMLTENWDVSIEIQFNNVVEALDFMTADRVYLHNIETIDHHLKAND